MKGAVKVCMDMQKVKKNNHGRDCTTERSLPYLNEFNCEDKFNF